jgi:2,3-dihydroxyphenylpropionate 1,2-dioxygenase
MRKAGIIAGAAVPHAPQFMSRPPTEDLDQVERVRVALAEVGDRLRALKPDLTVVITNDHGDEFVVGCVPPFLVHCGARAQGMHKHRGWWKLAGEEGYAVTRALHEEGFDAAFSLDVPVQTAFTIPYEFMGYGREDAFLPIFVNSYVPPQPSGDRCLAFGAALHRATERMGLRTVVIASGGFSHYPGTPQYPHPDVETDRGLFERIKAGNLRSLLTLDDAALDRSGNVEARSIVMLAGALGDRVPDITAWEPSWHHTYAVFGWTIEEPRNAKDLHYPEMPPERAQLARAIFMMRTHPGSARAYLADAAAYASGHALAPEEAEALIAFDEAALRDRFRIHPLLIAGAERRLAMLRNPAIT